MDYMERCILIKKGIASNGKEIWLVELEMVYLYLSECNNEVRIQGKCCQCSTYCEKGNCSSFS